MTKSIHRAPVDVRSLLGGRASHETHGKNLFIGVFFPFAPRTFRVRYFGRGSDPRKALWPAAMKPASQAGHMAAPTSNAKRSLNPCQRRAVHTWAQSRRPILAENGMAALNQHPSRSAVQVIHALD